METIKEVTCVREGNLLALIESEYPDVEGPKWLKKGLDRHEITLGFFEPLRGKLEEYDAKTLAKLLWRVVEHIGERKER